MFSGVRRNAISKFASGFLETFGRNHELLSRHVNELHDILQPNHTIVSVSDWVHQRQRILCSAGVPMSVDGAPLEMAICRYVGEGGLPIWFDNAELDPIFRRHPAVVEGGVRAYIGAPLIDGQGNHFGSICCRQMTPRAWSNHDQITILKMSDKLSDVMIEICDKEPWAFTTSGRAPVEVSNPPVFG
jgi:GAF domain-containing protein